MSAAKRRKVESSEQKVPSYPLADEFLRFVDASPSPYHAVDTVRKLLVGAGFQQLSESDAKDWSLQAGGKYFLTRNESTIMAFAVGGQYAPGNGVSIVAAHTDSPCPKVKPVSTKASAGYQQVGVELYGGGLWNTWFDRDLSVAGRVIVGDEKAGFRTELVRIDRPILRIPNLAIHLNRSIYTEGFKYNKETHVVPIIATEMEAVLNGFTGDEKKNALPSNAINRHHSVLVDAVATEMGISHGQLHDFELCLFDTQPASTFGVFNEFIASPRLDNLMMSFCSTRALLNSLDSLGSETGIRMVALFDNEEIGSASDRGAKSNMLFEVLTRIHASCSDKFSVAMRKSFLVSADMAHAIHPNYVSKHEENHRPAMHQGLVIKANANQRYATTGCTAFLLRRLAQRANIPVQDFVVRQDMGCGSTIGPILSTNCGIRTVDVGAPQLAMHSIREMCSTKDVGHSVNLFVEFFNHFAEVDSTHSFERQV